MSYYLLDFPNPHGQHFYSNRKPCQHGLTRPHVIVVHTAENAPDYVAPDDGAEAVARYASVTDRPVSWHVTVDSDSTISMLPDDYTAFHVRNYNRCSLGIELATKSAEWYGSPDDWRYSLLYRAVDVVADWCLKWNIPSTYVRKSQVDQGIPGITGHVELDPTRRTDPGTAFPWNWFLDRVSEKVEVGSDLRHTTLLDGIEAAVNELRSLWPT